MQLMHPKGQIRLSVKLVHFYPFAVQDWSFFFHLLKQSDLFSPGLLRHFQVKCHQRIISSDSSTGKFSTRIICCVTLEYFESLFSSNWIIFSSFLNKVSLIADVFLNSSRLVVQLLPCFPPTVALYIPTFYPACQPPPLNLARPSAPFTDSTIYSSTPWPGQCVCVPVVGPIDRMRKCGWRERSSPCSRWCPTAGWQLVAWHRLWLESVLILVSTGNCWCSCQPPGGPSEHDWEMPQCIFAFDELYGMCVFSLLPSTAEEQKSIKSIAAFPWQFLAEIK